MKKFIAIAILVIMTFTMFAGCDRILGKTGNNTNNNTSTETDPRFVKHPGEGMSEYDAYSYVNNMMYPACVAIDYYAGKGMEYNDLDTVEDNGTTYVRVSSSFATNLKELESYVSGFFAGEFLKNLRDSANMDTDKPRYKEFDGKLYMDISQQAADSLFNMQTDTFKIVENTETAIRFTMEGYIYGEKKTSKIILSLVDGAWRITYWNPESSDEATESN